MYMCLCPSQLVPACSSITVMATDVNLATQTHKILCITAVDSLLSAFIKHVKPQDIKYKIKVSSLRLLLLLSSLRLSFVSAASVCLSLFMSSSSLFTPECRRICSADQYVWPDVKGALPTLIISLGCSALLGGKPSITFNPPGDAATPPIPSPSTPK